MSVSPGLAFPLPSVCVVITGYFDNPTTPVFHIQRLTKLTRLINLQCNLTIKFCYCIEQAERCSERIPLVEIIPRRYVRTVVSY